MTDPGAIAAPAAAGGPGAFLHPFARVAAPREAYLEIVRGEGAHLFDSQGRDYVDALASLWFCTVGHGRAEIADAIGAQARTLAAYHCFDRFTNGPAEMLAERIAALAPVPGSRVFLASGGSEAVDSAVKLARLAHARRGEPERTFVIGRAPSYHGVNYGGTTLTGLPQNREGFGPGIGDVVQTPKDDLDAVRAAFEAHPGRVAAVISEPVIGAGGVHPPLEGYLAGLRALCDEHGAYLISDEVICAFGRLGGWFSAERYGVRPDLITFAKAVTSGYQPLGGVVVAPSVHEPLAADPTFVLRHGYTYSGHPTAAAAALVNLEIIEREGLLARADDIGKQLATGLGVVAERGAIAGVRGDGAVWAAVLHEHQNPVQLRDRMVELGVIARPIAPDAVAFCPPLVTADADVERMVQALAQAAGETA